MNPPQVYTCSASWIPLPAPSPYHPSGSSQCTSPKHPVSKLDWWFISYMILCMFPCHSPKSSHPLPLPQSPKDCSTHLCLFCCLAYRVIITIFPYHTNIFKTYSIIIICFIFFSFLTWYYTCFNAILSNQSTLSLSHRVPKTVLYICVSFAVSHTGLSLPSF